MKFLESILLGMLTCLPLSAGPLQEMQTPADAETKSDEGKEPARRSGGLGSDEPVLKQILEERHGAKVTLTIRPDNPKFQVLRDYCTVAIFHADGTQTRLPTFRTSVSDFYARIHPDGHVALLAGGGLLIYSKSKDKTTQVQILRKNLLKEKPEIDSFSIVDTAWTEDELVCAGTFRSESDSRFPFISKMQVDRDAKPSNHQILWTTWHPEATPPETPGALIHYAGNAIEGSLVATGGTLLWRNDGHWREGEFPDSDSAFLANSSWLVTNLETGVTGEATNLNRAGQSLLDKRNDLLLSHFKERLRVPNFLDYGGRLEYFIESFEETRDSRPDR